MFKSRFSILDGLDGLQNSISFSLFP